MGRSAQEITQGYYEKRREEMERWSGEGKSRFNLLSYMLSRERRELRINALSLHPLSNNELFLRIDSESGRWK